MAKLGFNFISRAVDAVLNAVEGLCDVFFPPPLNYKRHFTSDQLGRMSAEQALAQDRLRLEEDLNRVIQRELRKNEWKSPGPSNPNYPPPQGRPPGTRKKSK